MFARVVMTSPYPGFTIMAKSIAKELDLEVIIVEAVLEEAARKVREICEQNEIDVIVSRGGTAEAIKKVVDTPVILADSNDFDILMGLWEARKYSDKIGFLAFDYPKMSYEIQNLVDIIGVDIKQFLYRNTEDIIQQIEKAVQDDIKVMVGGGSFGVNLAKERGIHGILIRSSRRTLVQALQRAKWTLNIRDRDKKGTKQLQTIVDLSRDGIVSIDQNEVVTVFNPIAERIFNINRNEILNQPLSKFQWNRDIARVLGPDEETSGDVINVGGTSLLVNRALITVDNQNYGKVITFQEVSKLQQLEHSVRRRMHERGLVARFGFDDIKGNSEAIRKCIQRAKRFGVTDSTILITGESGTGKEMFAQSIHNISGRKDGPFVAVNCAALPENLLESELFGYEEGAFTGAKKGGKPGYFELAHGGTIFLDEIGTLPKNVQARLLRVLQEREVFRLGGDKVIPVDVRVIAATNEDLSEAVNSLAFRADLFYRLNVLNIKIPPLRERVVDIPLLVKHFLNVYNQRFQKSVQEVTPELMEWLCQYPWPGNIRELSNVIERLVILAEGSFIGMELLDMESIAVERENGEASNTEERLTISAGTLEEMEDQIIDIYVTKFSGNKTEIANQLGISRTTLWKRLKRLGYS
ncbi:MAG: sigma 54-interacting transcriptional regulator [Thermoanaerobacteraceae bacterium]|nr:sigma 54-interacting transcriptional regulator [Thermoanaerobacteraceae bacterium]